MNKTILIKMVVSLPVPLSVTILLHFAKIGSRINCYYGIAAKINF